MHAALSVGQDARERDLPARGKTRKLQHAKRPAASSVRAPVAYAPASDAETFHSLLNSAVAPMFALDARERIFFANRALADLIGVGADSLPGKSLAELADLMDGALTSPSLFKERVASLLADADSTTTELLEYRSHRRIHFKEVSQPVRGAKGEPLGRLFVYYEVTREKQIDQAKSEFISIVSHELRTPMTSVKGSLDLALGGFVGELSEELRELLGIAQNGCERLLRLINDILDLSKIESGHIQLYLRPMSLYDSAQRSARTIRSYAESFKVRIEIDCPQPVPKVLGDRDRLDQVLTNLLDNAVKYSPRGATVTIALRETEGTVECRVIDHGPGIPTEQLERIFGKFQQVEAGGREKKGGTGLGLPIARALVQEHGGNLWAESEAGQGSRFIFRIPVSSRTD